MYKGKYKDRYKDVHFYRITHDSTCMNLLQTVNYTSSKSDIYTLKHFRKIILCRHPKFKKIGLKIKIHIHTAIACTTIEELKARKI